MSNYFVVLLAAAVVVCCAAENKFATFYGTKAAPKVTDVAPGADDKMWVAQAEYSPAADHKSNFAQLSIKTNPTFDDNTQTYAAGFLEGQLTAETIHQHYDNMVCQVDCSGEVSPELQDFFTKQDAWSREQVAKHPDCPYWGYIGTLLSQMDGMIAGYGASSEAESRPLSLWAFTLINSMGDLFDIIPATQPSKRPLFHKMDYKKLQMYMNTNGHCSALIRVLPGLEEIFVGHTSWFTYSSMLRIYKSYEFHLQNKASATTKQMFSSYPGMQSSLDDMYMMSDSNLIMTQTTNNIFNETLWDLIVPESLLAWQRVRSANQLATTGPEWYNIVSKHNSGTYNNQYMILDLKKWLPYNAMPPNTLFVVEQIPGLVQGSDVTDVLERGYWGSYNVPFHREIYVKSGYEVVDKAGGHALYTEYQQAPRAKIFRRDQSSVGDLTSMQHMMRYNQFQTDPYAEGDAWGAIAARGDLNESPSAAGGYDTKVTSDKMFKAGMQVSVVNGPTSQDQKPFTWSTSGLTDRHVGQPDVFDFEFELVAL